MAALATDRIVANLRRLFAPPGHGEIKMIVREKAGARPVDGRNGFLERIMIRIGLGEYVDEALSAGGVDLMPARIIKNIVAVTMKVEFRDFFSRLGVEDQ